MPKSESAEDWNPGGPSSQTRCFINMAARKVHTKDRTSLSP